MITILTHEQIQHKIRRIAYQIHEVTLGEATFILAGIEKNGFLLAQKILRELEKISPAQVQLCSVRLSKQNPLAPVQTSLPLAQCQNQTVILVDDVLNSGATLIYGVRHFLQVPLKQFKTVVLIDRNHKKFPIKADFKGLSLSTSLQEHVEVVFAQEDVAYLH